jgi:hypothetical protein
VAIALSTAPYPGLLDEGALDLRPALVAFVVERPGQRCAGLPFAQGGKCIAVARQDLVASPDGQLHWKAASIRIADAVYKRGLRLHAHESKPIGLIASKPSNCLIEKCLTKNVSHCEFNLTEA